MGTKDPIQGNIELEDCGEDVQAEGQIRLFEGNINAQDQYGPYNLRQITYLTLTTEGGVVYDANGDLVLKAVP